MSTTNIIHHHQWLLLQREIANIHSSQVKFQSLRFLMNELEKQASPEQDTDTHRQQHLISSTKHSKNIANSAITCETKKWIFLNIELAWICVSLYYKRCARIIGWHWMSLIFTSSSMLLSLSLSHTQSPMPIKLHWSIPFVLPHPH